MAGFSKTDGPTDPNEDVITIHLGRVLSQDEYEAVLQSIVAFMNMRWPNLLQVGRDS